MNGISIKRITDPAFLVFAIGKIAINSDAVKELGEPITYIEGDTWLVDQTLDASAFACVNGEKLRYLYVSEKNRGVGLGGWLLWEVDLLADEFDINRLIAVCPDKYLNWYLNRGWKLIQQNKNYHKIEKQYG